MVSRKRIAVETPERQAEAKPVSEPQPKPKTTMTKPPRSTLFRSAAWLALALPLSLDA